ncbi:hypothetical protein NMG60_11029902 [Bertholletia excelsa]
MARGMAEQAYTVASDSETTGEEKCSSAFPEIAIGIDIGTSQCSVAVWNGSQVELLRNTRNLKHMRSYVTFKDEIPSSGVSNQLTHEYEMLSGAAIFNMKRLIGRVDTDPVVHSSKSLPFLVQTLDIVLAIYLMELRVMAEAQLNRPVRNVVLTIPVSFSRFQLTRIERACAMAGLHVLRLMPEPTAVALLYAQQQQKNIHENMGSGIEKIALIFNMGAGYCDVAITATAGGVSQIKALSGSTIGGEDMLQNMMHHLLPDMETSDIKSMGLLRVATQDAIHKLSSQTISKIVNREEFEEVNNDVFEKFEDVNDTILVGGCSYVPKVRNLVTSICKREIVYMDITHWRLPLDLLTIQATPLSIGIRADGNNFVPIIHRNTTIPSRRDLIFTTVHDNQSEALILVYEGDEKAAEKNHLLGYFKVTGIPPAPKGVPEINVCVDIDASDVLRVLAGVTLPGNQHPVAPFMEVRMPTIDDGHGWCGEALLSKYGSALDLITVQKKIQKKDTH